MRLMSIASGSSGNCIYAGSDDTHILVDAGISNKRIEDGLNEIGLKASEIDAIVITHEHADHIKGLGVLSRKYEIPIYATAGTVDELRKADFLGEMPDELFHTVSADVDFTLGDVTIRPFTICHDAAEPVGYRFQCGNTSIAVATDMGHYDQYIIDHLMGLDAVLIEANHDVRMLKAGSYPYYLKQRILSDTGHLSNENAGRLIDLILHDGMKNILLGHLSKENNFPELAYETVKLEIDQGDSVYKSSDFPISVARRDEMSELVCV